MTTSWRSRSERRLHGKAPPPRFVPRRPAGDELIKRNRPVAGPQPARRAEVGNAALGRNPRAGKRNDNVGFGDHLAEPLHATPDVRSNHYRSDSPQVSSYQ